MITLEEWAELSWKLQHGDKSYEEVEREYEERRARDADKILADLPYKEREDKP